VAPSFLENLWTRDYYSFSGSIGFQDN